MTTTWSTDFRFNVTEGAAFLDAMANANRLKILDVLQRGEMSVGVLSETIGLSQSALSQHLAKLRAAKLVITRREAQTIYYFCTAASVARVLNILSEYFEEDARDRKVA